MSETFPYQVAAHIQRSADEICKRQGWPAGYPITTRARDGSTYTCKCFAVGFALPIAAGDGAYVPADYFEPGDAVRASGADLRWRTRSVAFSGGIEGLAPIRSSILVAYESAAVAVAEDHLFLLAGGKLKRADRLAPDDLLLSPSGRSVAITAIHVGDFMSVFHHIAAGAEPPGPDLDGHLLDTNGVVSADYAAQLYARAGVLDENLYVPPDAAPPVGSPDYVARHGEGCLLAPSFDLSTATIPGGGAATWT